jgi:hypothetical protein
MKFLTMKFSESLVNFPFLTLKYPTQLFPLKYIQVPLFPQALRTTK